MKKLLIAASLLIFSFGCQSGETQKDEDKEKMRKEAEEAEQLDDDIEEIDETQEGDHSTMEEAADEKPEGTTYRSDGYRPGLASEWVQVKLDDKTNEIAGIWYWDIKNTTPQKLNILKQEFHEGEIAGFTGELVFPDDPNDKFGFGIVEGNFNLTHGEDKMQTFEAE